MRLETSGDNPFTTSALVAGVQTWSYPIRSRPARTFMEQERAGTPMHWRRKVGVFLIFVCMPAMAPLWSMLGENAGFWPWSTEAMIRLLTPFFVFGLLLTLAGVKENQVQKEEEE